MNAKQHDTLLATLQARFDQHPERHQGIDWADVQARLKAAPAKLKALEQMEATGGEPDVVGRESASGAILFFDCSAETPAGRRSLCYDREALDARKKDKPAGCATEQAAQIGIELLDEAQYRQLQELGSFDQKTSSWLRTPGSMRKLDGALFGDRRYERVFTYHNGVQSYYAARGFRGVLKV
ncbi:DUF4256 domain-containing protein [Pseudomonas sp. PDM17]|uniref:DUF4256 domain-containing protein n=1 Tax=Pseudomonas sp. PDM17 TaxID=2769285 RepID=UPI00177B849F|nr:DUF4256 domain-containing protein [Pseudomonas sp. PDM17]MBD9503883.1 DUF4256 domain-containing protein [Pseudomonas sp. PDM17]